jgi:hypothetical protein
MDNDAKILAAMGNALVDLQVKYRNSPLADRMMMKPTLDQLVQDYAEYQIRLLKEGVVSSDTDLQEMQQIQAEIKKAASTQKLLVALARTVAFVATKI